MSYKCYTLDHDLTAAIAAYIARYGWPRTIARRRGYYALGPLPEMTA